MKSGFNGFHSSAFEQLNIAFNVISFHESSFVLAVVVGTAKHAVLAVFGL
jgi:hypothetical protein